MCWETDKRPVEQVAKEDLSFYKIFSKGLISPIREFKYSYNTLYTQKIHFVAFDQSISEGFHWYTTESIAKANNDYEEEGDKILRVIIPKGSHYYINEYGHGVSDMIYIPEESTKPSLLRRILDKIKFMWYTWFIIF